MLIQKLKIKTYTNWR